MHSLPSAAMANFYNIVPVFPNHRDFTVSEIRRQHREVGLDKFLLCLSFHPQRTPARDLIPELCSAFTEVRAGLVGEGVELGVLVQSILGHGWNGKVPLTGEKWQHVVLVDGSESPRFCVLDEGFREYTREVIRAVATLGPSLMLLDDDIGIRANECFCPLHLAALSRSLGREVSREELVAMYRGGSIGSELAIAACDAFQNSITGYARMVRETIDAVNPSLRCGICSCWDGQWQMHEVVKTLAGGTRPLMRVNDAIYGDQKPSAVAGDFILASRVRFRTAIDGEFLDETDTFPHNPMSVSANVFHAHITSAMLAGLDGCKLWTSEYQQPVDTGSQRRYEARLRGYRPFYEKLNALAPQVEWRGVAFPLYVPRDGVEGNPFCDGAGTRSGGWGPSMEVSFGIPVRCAEPGSKGVVSLRGDEATWMEDHDIVRLLSGRAIVDSEAARILTGRGFSDLLGARATAGGEDFSFSTEQLADGSLDIAFLWDETASLLEPEANGVETISWFCRGRRFIDEKPSFPSATLFTNRLGGCVAVLGWSFDMAFHKQLRPLRRKMLLHILDRLAGERLEMAVETGEQAFARHGVLPDGTEIVAVFPCGYDIDDVLPLRMFRTPKRVEALLPNGNWSPVAFRRTGAEIVEIDVRVSCAEPIILCMHFA